MLKLEDVQTATQLSGLLGRVTAAFLKVCSNILATAPDGNDAKLLWVKAAWFTGDAPRFQWWGQRALQHAVIQSPQLQAAIAANPTDPQVTDADITAFVTTYVQRCVDLNIK